MKSFRIFALITVMACLVVNAQAYEVNKPYIGGKFGLMMPDGSGIDDALNLGVVFGMPLIGVQGQNISGTVSLEGELTTTIIDGDISGGGEWDVLTLGGYGVFRSGGQVYFKGKAGLVYWDASYHDGPFSGSDDDINLSFGFGGGYRLSSEVSAELEYTILDSDIDFLSLGFNVNF